MILTCPDCATRYFVDEAKLGPGGRKVRCASCGASWRAEAEPEPLDLAAAALPVAPPSAPAEPVRPADALPKSFRAQQEARRRTRQAVAAGVVWASLAAVFVAVVLAAVIFRVQVVRLWPRTAGAYAALRLPVNPLGLSPEAVQASPGLQGGHAMLFVHGLERNVEAAPRPPAALRVSLYDKAGERLATQVVRVQGAPLKPGETRAFQAGFTDPPLAGTQVGVDFIFEPAARVRPASAARMAMNLDVGAAPDLRGPAPAALLAPRRAQPLPATSPYALPAAASAQATGAQASPGRLKRVAQPPFPVLLRAEEIARAVEQTARRIAPELDDEAVIVCLLTGGLWFAADLTRALARLGRHPLFDALWLASYGDGRVSGGAAQLRAALQRPVQGRDVLIVDDVLDTGLSLADARTRVLAAGARSARTAVFARKPCPSDERLEPDFVAWEAPARYLAGYGMDEAGRYRGLPDIVALD